MATRKHLHILLIHQAFAALDEPGGTRHHEFARFLVAQGNRVTVIASPISYLTGSVSGKRIRWVDKQVDDLGVTIIRAYTYKALHRSFVHRMFSFLSFMFSSFLIGISVTKVDLVWGTSPPIFQGVTAWVLARIKRVHFIFEVRDLWPAFAVAVGVLRNPVLIRASEWLERFLYRHADKVIVNSPGFVEHMETSGATDIVLVPNGTDTRMFDPKSNGADFRRAHGLNGKFVALYAGAHGLSNDLGVLLEAAKLLEINNEIAIVLLGDGKEKAALMAQAKEMSLINVHFISSIPKNEMPEALAAANACIAILKPIPLYGTVYPNKVFDYMAAGRPIILAIDGVVRKLVEDSGGGEFVQPGDSLAVANSIRRMAADPNSSRKMGLAGRAFVGAHFERSSLAQKLLDVMENMMDPPAV